jgi:hypothetical protein
MNTEYKETGKKVEISVKELAEWTNKLLEEYDAGSASERAGMVNPYVQDIIYTTKAGTTIKIPKELQQDIVAEWVNTNTSSSTNQVMGRDEAFGRGNDETGNIDEADEAKSTSQWSKFIKIGFFILVVLLLYYASMKYGWLKACN